MEVQIHFRSLLAGNRNLISFLWSTFSFISLSKMVDRGQGARFLWCPPVLEFEGAIYCFYLHNYRFRSWLYKKFRRKRKPRFIPLIGDGIREKKNYWITQGQLSPKYIIYLTHHVSIGEVNFSVHFGCILWPQSLLWPSRILAVHLTQGLLSILFTPKISDTLPLGTLYPCMDVL